MAYLENTYNQVQAPDLSQYATQEARMAALRKWQGDAIQYEKGVEDPSYWLNNTYGTPGKTRYNSYNEMMADPNTKFGTGVQSAALYEPWKRDVAGIQGTNLNQALNRYGQQQSVRQNNPNQNARTTAMKQYLSGAVY